MLFAMELSDLATGTRVLDRGRMDDRVLIVDRQVHRPGPVTVECHYEDDPTRRARCWITSLTPAPAAATPARSYRWEDLRDTTAGALRVGDTVFSLAAFQVVHVAKDGRVSGGHTLGQLTPRGMARSVIARDGNRITFRNHPDGREWSQDIEPDYPLLRVHGEG